MAGPLPLWLRHPVVPRLNELYDGSSADKKVKFFQDSPHAEPNHVLVNEYKPGQGIMPHEDGSAYWPVVATVSLSAPIVLEIYEKNDDGQRKERPTWRILQEARSLLITTDEMYKVYLHGIANLQEDRDISPETITNWDLLGEKGNFTAGSYERSARTSLTYRDVLKVSDLSKKLGIFGKR
ncbi:MAG: Ankyrin repeat domain-containing protein 11 [Chaenotheca gracillima]|nr:MAG: Ankyrin repeat domain-containing protein 11 [Chaenotheca gracillima]